MGKSFYARLAVQGIRKNGKIYIPYILTSIGTVMMYYIVSYLTYSKSVYNMYGGRDLQMILSWGTGVIAVFSVIFLFYTSSFVIRSRKKEFGLYTILGMGKMNVARIIFWETLFSYLISIISGIWLGIIFSKLAELLSAKILGDKAAIGFSIERQSLINTVLLFTVIFGIILLNSLRHIHLSNPINLLHGSKAGDKPPKAKGILALFGLAMLGVAYWISCTITEPMEALLMFFLAVILTIIATYILFTVGSVALCKMLQKNKKYYYKTEHFVSVSSMSYRMKRNGASLATICILSTMVLVMISSTLCLYVGKEDSINTRYPRDIDYRIANGEESHVESLKSVVQSTLDEYGLTAENVLDYDKLSFAILVDEDKAVCESADVSPLGVEKVKNLYVISVNDYNKYKNSNIELEPDEVLMFSERFKYNYDTIDFKDFGTFRIKEHLDDSLPDGLAEANIVSSIYIFVSEERLRDFYEYQHNAYGEKASEIGSVYDFDLSCSEEIKSEVYDKIGEKIENLQSEDEAFPTVYSESQEKERKSYISMFGGLFFLGIMLSIVFILAAVLIMYYKQINEGYEDAGRFEIMQKVGMTKKEIRRSIKSQILTVFFAPLITAGLHMTFAFPIISRLLRLFGLFNTPLLIAVTDGAFAVFAVFYAIIYKITSRSYYKIVS